jgi:hypothetical protein
MNEPRWNAPRVAPTAEDAVLDGVVEKLSRKFGGNEGPLSDEKIVKAVRDAADSLRDVPVQAFVPLLTENKARRILEQLAEDQVPD